MMRASKAGITGGPRVALLVLGFALLLAAWTMATVPFAAPDEASHYLRALSLANGHLLGPKVDYHNPTLTPTQEAFINRDTRAVMVPARLDPPDVGCIDGKRDTRRCLEATPSGNFPPLPYVLPALALKVSNDTSTAIWLTRVASALPAFAFLVVAVALLWNGTAWSLLGLLAATTPMVLYSASILNPSGVGTTSCLALTAAVLRVTRSPARAPTWVWAAFSVAGAVAILSGPIGLVFVAGNLVLFAGLLGRRGLGELRDTSRARLGWSAVALLGAVVLSLIYRSMSGLAPLLVRFTPVGGALHSGIDQLRSVIQEVVGNFGSLTVPLPLGVSWIWWLLVLSLLAGALWLGDRRDRIVVAAVTVLSLAFPVLFYAWIDRQTGFGLQGREVLPALTLIPLVAGETIYRRRSALSRRRAAPLMLGGAIALVAAFEAYAWWYNARSQAGGIHKFRFYVDPVWSPPLGWLPWIAVAAVGTLTLLTFAAAEARARPLEVESAR